MPEARAIVLLEATLEILNQANHDSLSRTAFYDDAHCDGFCLRDDIKHYLYWASLSAQ